MQRGPDTQLMRVELDVPGAPVTLAAPAQPDAVQRAAAAAGDAHAGLWATVWPASRALARWAGRSAWLGPGVRVLEVGCGLGLPSIVAARRGADVIATDRSAAAVEYACESARRSGVGVRAATFDVEAGATALQAALASIGDARWRPDLLIAADVLYHPRTHEPIASLLRDLEMPAVLVDPNRPTAAPAADAFARVGLRVRTEALEPVERAAMRAFIVMPG